jgi:hypothetical protein
MTTAPKIGPSSPRSSRPANSTASTHRVCPRGRVSQEKLGWLLAVCLLAFLGFSQQRADAQTPVNVQTTSCVTDLRNIAPTSYPQITTLGSLVMPENWDISSRPVTPVIVTSGGTGYTLHQNLTVSGSAITAATLEVEALSGSTITAVSVVNNGCYASASPPSSSIGVTVGTATFNVTLWESLRGGTFDWSSSDSSSGRPDDDGATIENPTYNTNGPYS